MSPAPDVAALVLSDRAAAGIYPDGCLPALAATLPSAWNIVEGIVIPDDPAALQARLIAWVERRISLIFTCGGTGLGPRDRTPQATGALLDYEIPGLAEVIRADGLRRGIPTAALGRGVVGVRDRTLIVNLPGKPSAVAEALTAILPMLPHALASLQGETVHDADPATPTIAR